MSGQNAPHGPGPTHGQGAPGGYGPPAGYSPQPAYGPPPPGYGPAPWLPGDVDVVGQRVGQYLLDGLVAVVPMIVLIIVGSVLTATGSTTLAVIGLLISLVGYLSAFVGSFVVLAWWPATHQGQTPAMGWLGLRVVREEDGGEPTLGQHALRWVLLIVEGGVIGLIVMVASQRKQRLGDMAARTLVVRA